LPEFSIHLQVNIYRDAKLLVILKPNFAGTFYPFCGSGTTLKVSLLKGFNTVGVELNAEFCVFIKKTLSEMA